MAQGVDALMLLTTLATLPAMGWSVLLARALRTLLAPFEGGPLHCAASSESRKRGAQPCKPCFTAKLYRNPVLNWAA